MTSNAHALTLHPATLPEVAAAAPAERRAARRRGARLVVHFAPLRPQAAQRLQAGRSEDASSGGLFVATHRPPPRRTVVRFEAFHEVAAGEEPVRGVGVVRWRRRWRRPRGFGVEILRISVADGERLERWLQERDEAAAETAGGAP